MNTRYCTICSCAFDLNEEGTSGDIGIIPVAFCAVCQSGIRDFAEQTWDLAATGEHRTLTKCPECGKVMCECQ
jgi:hypothetical protein